MSVRADTVLMDYRPPIGPDPESELTLQIGTKETKAVALARTRRTWISAETYQSLGIPSGEATPYLWETRAETVPPEIEEGAEMGEQEKENDASEAQGKEDDENTKRLKLLARKYARKALTREEEARLEIVSERVRQLMPRVTAQDFERLEALAKEVSRLRELDEEVRRKIGLSDAE